MTIKFKPTKRAGDFLRTFSSEDGKHFRGERQDLEPAIKRTAMIREMEAARGTGQYDRRYIGSVPFVVITDWITKRGYTMHQWSINEGGSPCPIGGDPMEHIKTDGGIKSQFLRYFLSRDFSKLHTAHTTTRRESSQIVVPDNYIGGNHGTEKLRRAEGSGS